MGKQMVVFLSAKMATTHNPTLCYNADRALDDTQPRLHDTSP